MLRRYAIALLVVMGCASSPARGNGGWEALGARQVSDQLDHDLIPVAAGRGTFRSIKLSVQRAPVDFDRVIVHFGNGADQDITMRATIAAGGESRVIDLAGADRTIRSVEFWYDATTARGRNAQVRLHGLR